MLVFLRSFEGVIVRFLGGLGSEMLGPNVTKRSVAIGWRKVGVLVVSRVQTREQPKQGTILVLVGLWPSMSLF